MSSLTQQRETDISRNVSSLTVFLVLTAIYFLAGKLGLRLAFVNASATAVWPPTGIALASFLIFGYRVWPSIFLGALLVNVTTAGGVGTSCGIALGNTLEGLLGAYLVNRFANGRNVFDRPLDAFKFFLLAGVVSTTVSATIGVAALVAGGLAQGAQAAPIWLTWWLGDAGGDLIVAPLLLLWHRSTAAQWDHKTKWEYVLLLSAVSLTAFFIFPAVPPLGAGHLPLEIICVPFIAWAALRFDQREVAVVVALISLLAIFGTIRGGGPFAASAPNHALLLLQIFMGVTSMTALGMTAALSDRKRAHEKERVRAGIEREQLELFASVAAHDLQEPLRKIALFGEMLERESEGLNDTGKKHLARMQNAARRMSQLISELLAYSKSVSLKNPSEKVDLNSLVVEVLRDLDLRIREAGAQITVEELPHLTADRAHLRTLFQNLIGNSLKFRKKESSLSIAIGVRRFDDVQEIFVRDNGIGFDPKYSKNVFMPFTRLHPASEFDGHGLGLAICQRIVTLHGGQISVESSVGQGTLVTVAFPENRVLRTNAPVPTAA